MAEEPEQLQDKESATQNKALNKITDHVEDKELDQNKTRHAMQRLAAAQKAGKDAQRQRERELAAVKCSKADVQTVATEFEVDAKAAERRLREHRGNLRSALQSFLVA